MRHSRGWHEVLDRIQFGGLPVVSAHVRRGDRRRAGTGHATHVRDRRTIAHFQLPEGRRGIFVGGGATVRVGRILGADRMTEMMLTGRKYDAEEGVALGLAHYAVATGEALGLWRRDSPRQIAENAPLSNYMMIQAWRGSKTCRAMTGCLPKASAPRWPKPVPMRKRGSPHFWKNARRSSGENHCAMR